MVNKDYHNECFKESNLAYVKPKVQKVNQSWHGCHFKDYRFKGPLITCTYRENRTAAVYNWKWRIGQHYNSRRRGAISGRPLPEQTKILTESTVPGQAWATLSLSLSLSPWGVSRGRSRIHE